MKTITTLVILLASIAANAQQSIFVQPSVSLAQSQKTNAVRVLFEAGAYGTTIGIYHRRHLLGMDQDQNFNGLELKKYFGKQIGAFGSLQWERGLYNGSYHNRHTYGIGVFGKLENARFTAEYTPNAYKGDSFTFGMGYVINLVHLRK